MKLTTDFPDLTYVGKDTTVTDVKNYITQIETQLAYWKLLRERLVYVLPSRTNTTQK